MASDRQFYRVTCSACQATSVVSQDGMLERLREAGMLRRQKEPALDMIEALLPTASARLRCHECRNVGLQWEYDDGDWGDEAWEQARSCKQCGKTIPAERVELFPNVEFCVACQRAEEEGGRDEEPEFCPRCGAVMSMRLRRGSGIASYQMVCPDCRR